MTSSLQQVVKQSEENEKLEIKKLITGNSLDAAAAHVSASRRKSSSPYTSPNSSFTNRGTGTHTNSMTNPYYASQPQTTPTYRSSYPSNSGRGRGKGRGGGRGRGRRGGRGRGRRGGSSYNHYSSYETNYSSTLKSYTIGADARTGASVESALNPNQQLDRSSSYSSLGSAPGKRPYDPLKAAAIQKAKYMQDEEERPYQTIEGPFCSIDVECVASGYGHSTLSKDRIPGRIAMVDEVGNTILDEIVRLDAEKDHVVSFLTPLTGLNKSLCSRQTNKTFEEIVELVKEKMPKNGVLVGQSIQHDIEWLGLEKGVDFRDYIDIGTIFRQRVPSNLKKIGSSNAQDPNQEDEQLETRYRIFSLRHTCLYLLGVDIQTSYHDPTVDAKYSIDLFNKYREQQVEGLRAARDSLHRAPVTPSFASMNPVVDGVCLSKQAYKYKFAGRFIWKWWTSLYGGVFGLTPLAVQAKKSLQNASSSSN